MTATLGPSRHAWTRELAGRLSTLFPGIILCAAVAFAARCLQTFQDLAFGHVWIESLAAAILVGAAVRAVWTPGQVWRTGVEASARTLLEVAVVLLGASLDISAMRSAGIAFLFGVACVVVISLLAGYAIGRSLGLPPCLALLVASGNAICGNSAIAAVASVIKASGEEVATAIAFTAVLGIATVLGLPLLGQALGVDDFRFGAFAGLTVYAIPQVLAVTAPLGTAAVQVGTLVKLGRVVMIGPVCLILSLLWSRSPSGHQRGTWRFAAGCVGHVPWFIIGFAGVAVLRSLGLVPVAAGPLLAVATALLTTMAMAGLGLGTEIRSVAQAGPRAAAAVISSLAVLVLLSLWLIEGLHVG